MNRIEIHEDHTERRAVERRSFEACPRYDKHELSEDQILDIAKKAVLMAKDEFYKDVGRNVTSKLLVAVGIIVVGALTWLTSNGYTK